MRLMQDIYHLSFGCFVVLVGSFVTLSEGSGSYTKELGRSLSGPLSAKLPFDSGLL